MNKATLPSMFFSIKHGTLKSIGFIFKFLPFVIPVDNRLVTRFRKNLHQIYVKKELAKGL